MNFREFINPDPKYMTDDQIGKEADRLKGSPGSIGRVQELELEFGRRGGGHSKKVDQRRAVALTQQATDLRRAIHALDDDMASHRKSALPPLPQDTDQRKSLEKQLAAIQHKLDSLSVSA